MASSPVVGPCSQVGHAHVMRAMLASATSHPLGALLLLGPQRRERRGLPHGAQIESRTSPPRALATASTSPSSPPGAPHRRRAPPLRWWGAVVVDNSSAWRRRDPRCRSWSAVNPHALRERPKETSSPATAAGGHARHGICCTREEPGSSASSSLDLPPNRLRLGVSRGGQAGQQVRRRE